MGSLWPCSLQPLRLQPHLLELLPRLGDRLVQLGAPLKLLLDRLRHGQGQGQGQG